MLKGLYIAPVDIESEYYIGVKNKILSQIKAFNNLNCDMDLIYIKEKGIYINNSRIRCLNISGDFYGSILDYDIKGYDFIYIRYIPCSINMVKVLNKIKKFTDNIIVEIPTYPYINELKNDINKIKFIFKDYLVTSKLRKYIRFITTTNEYERIWGVDTIQIRNGINIDDFPLTKREKISCEFNMVGLANLNSWHGYDRIINGLKDFYNKEQNINIKFYIIGDGKEKPNLETLVKQYELDDKVIFLGPLRGKELDLAMDKMDIAVSSLALHRAGGGHDPIKTKEFIGRGLPVVVGYEDKLVDMSYDFIIKVPEDDSSVNIKYVYERYNNIKNNKENLRTYARDFLSWESQLSKVVDLLK